MSILSQREYYQAFLHFLNCYLFWFVLQSIRAIPVSEEFVIQIIVTLIVCVILELFLRKFLKNSVAMSISALIIIISQFILIFYEISMLYIVIFIFYGIFFRGYFSKVSQKSQEMKIDSSILITISLSIAFVLNSLERLFLLHFNPIIVFIASPTMFILLILFLKKEQDPSISSESSQSTTPTIKEFTIKELGSIFITLVISCIFSFFFVQYNNPSLVAVVSRIDYARSNFTILMGIIIFSVICIFGSKWIFSTQKSTLIFMILTSCIVLIASILSFMVMSEINLIFQLISIVMLLMSFTAFINFIQKKQMHLPFLLLMTINLAIFAITSAIGKPYLFFMIISIVLMGGVLLFVAIYGRSFELNIKVKPSEINKKVLGIVLIILIIIPVLPLFKSAVISNTTNSREKRVMAFYYTWYGNPSDYTDTSLGIVDPRTTDWYHWNHGSTTPTLENYAGANAPAYGLYDSNDPEIIKTHFELAEEAGIDSFICTWWGLGSTTDTSFNNLMIMAEELNPDLELTIYYETNSGRVLDIPIPDAIELISSEVIYILDKYGDSDYFLKVDGKPVIFFYTEMAFSTLVWERISSKIREKHDCYLSPDLTPYPEARTELLNAFDGVHIYNPTHYINMQRQFKVNKTSLEDIGRLYQSMSLTAKSQGKISALTVIPGYDDRVIRDPGILVIRQEGYTYDYLWKASIDADADWVLITSFNEWHEGTDIEPSLEYGDYYIERTAYWSQIFKAS